MVCSRYVNIISKINTEVQVVCREHKRVYEPIKGEDKRGPKREGEK
jgi:hypothetical protein